MAFLTCNLANGVKPRVYEMKSKAKARPTKDNSKTKPKGNHRKHITSSDEESEEEDKDSQLSDREKGRKDDAPRSLTEKGRLRLLIKTWSQLGRKLRKLMMLQVSRKQLATKIAELEEKPVKKDLTLDLLTIMTDKFTVKFKTGPTELIATNNQFVKHMKNLRTEIIAAPGMISITKDGWSVDTMKASFQGMLAHWIEVKDRKWKMQVAVIGFKALSGAHSGEKLGSCLGHVVNLGNVDVMKHITKIAAVKNATAIWEYDPTHDDNHVLGGSLDVIPIALFLTLADELYSPIATLHCDNQLVKHILWMCSRWWSKIGSGWLMPTTYWLYVSLFSVQQYFSSEKQPTLWPLVATFFIMQTRWLPYRVWFYHWK
ncbi:hypothetical protein GALMADRAFT_210753 [Galerina marginata CBS 339.88]|uniref:Uncharacterized protein n=1 Tax=Galerina marginata (strain CBS 339.88) TaxID=685588 RepID=A0A067SYN9_GALM3|nr:hypothetical protein GALMADRAFT_210753 [Galerina marginata CBS 339.88]